MVKAAIAFLTMLIVTGKGLLLGKAEIPPTTPTPEPQVTVQESDAGFIVAVDPANLYTVSIPADWQTLYLSDKDNVKSGIVAYNSSETFLMRNYASTESYIKDDADCSTPAAGQITVDDRLTSYSECSGSNNSKILKAMLVKDNLYYHYLFQYDPQEYPQGSELAKTILASISFIK